MIVVEISAGFSWYCADCGLAWPGPLTSTSGPAPSFPCPHCGERCQAEVWGGTRHQVEWRPPVCSVPWNACPGCSRPWEYFAGERRCFHCDIVHVGGSADGCSDVPAAVVVVDDGDTRVFCACHTEVALREMRRARRYVDLTGYQLPVPTIGAPA